MKTKLKKCLAALIIIVTCFCVVDNNFVVGKFFASFIIPNAYAINPDEADDSDDTTTEDQEIQAFKSKMVEIARSIADDTYYDSFESHVHPKYTYHYGGDGTRETGFNGVSYCTYDCRGLVAASIRYASKALNFHKDKFANFYIWSTRYEYKQLTETGLWGCHKVGSKSELQDGDILLNSGHTEIFFRKGDGTPMQVGACQTSTEFYRADGETKGSCDPKDSIKEREMYDWEAYFRYGTVSDYYPVGTIADGEDVGTGQLGSGRYYTGPIDESAELDEQVFDFQGNPQKMVYDGSTNFSMWLFKLLSQFLDFITGLLVSLLINPIMQLLNAIVNFLTNFINYISGLPMGT